MASKKVVMELKDQFEGLEDLAIALLKSTIVEVETLRIAPEGWLTN